MELKISGLVKLYKFPMGRAKFALHSVATRAVAAGATRLAELAHSGALYVQRAMNLNTRDEVAGDRAYTPETAVVDDKLDGTLAGTHSTLQGQIRAYSGEPMGDAARRVRDACFPKGLGEITMSAYAEQHSKVDTLLERVDDPALAADIALLPGIPELFGRIRDLNEEYGKVLQLDNGPTRTEVRESRARTQELLCEMTCAIIGEYASQPDKQAERADLLAPILEQNEAIRLARRRRRRQLDVDPETGEDLPEPTDEPTDIPTEEPTGSTEEPTVRLTGAT